MLTAARLSLAPSISALSGLTAVTALVTLITLITLITAPSLASAQAVVNTVKLGPCDDLTGVCLANPTQRYKHGVFGQPFEYGTMMTIDQKGSALQPYNLPYEQVFEDRRVRLTDLDDDGTKEVITIVTSLTQGASVALFAFDPGNETESASVYPMAQSDFIGLANRWLNPLDGAVDLDGDGSREIAVIETPHIRPTLRIHQWNGSRLDEIARVPLQGHSNHEMGSLTLAGAVFCDAARAGQALVQIPDRAGSSTVFLFDLATASLKPTALVPSARVNPDFFDQNLACADLRQQS